MYRKLSTALAILATTAGVSALASSAQAQISGTIGGDVVDNDSVRGHAHRRQRRVRLDRGQGHAAAHREAPHRPR